MHGYATTRTSQRVLVDFLHKRFKRAFAMKTDKSPSQTCMNQRMTKVKKYQKRLVSVVLHAVSMELRNTTHCEYSHERQTIIIRTENVCRYIKKIHKKRQQERERDFPCLTSFTSSVDGQSMIRHEIVFFSLFL